MMGTQDQAQKATLTKSLVHLSSILEKVDSGQGTLGGLINDPSIHSRLKEMIGANKRSSEMSGLVRKTIQSSSGE